LDQRMALNWIKQNIHLFGGDPNAVTISGESAGGSSVCFHMVTENSKGLFSKAIIESGACYDETEYLTKAHSQGVNIQNYLQCSGTNPQIAECLRSKTAAELLNAQNKAGFSTSAVVDGLEIKEHPYRTVINQKINPVPLISGNVLNEGTLFAGGITRPVSNQTYMDYINTNYGTYASQFAKQYPCTTSDCWYSIAEIVGDRILVCPTIQIANSLITAGTPNYAYVFSHAPYWAHNPDNGAFHSSEIAFVFSTLATTYSYQPDEIPLAQQMTTLWTNFASSGSPLKPVNPNINWPAYTSTTKPRIVLNIDDSTLNQWKTAQCDLWNTLYQTYYPS